MKNRRRPSVLIVGAGQAGQMLAANLREQGAGAPEPVAFVDDDSAKLGALVSGLPVLGATVHIPDIVRRYKVDEVLIAIPSATGRDLRRITEYCRIALVPFKTTPPVSDLAGCNVTARQIREVRIEDLLGREPVQLDEARIAANLTGHCLLVTGAGGSIGSELTRQAAKAGVAKLVLFERAESDLFDIEVDLRHRFPSLDIETIVGDVLDVEHLADVFARERPSRVCHAAAYKHVPLMERHVLAAVRNNIIGTANVARAAAAVGTEQFVLVSSDKAIRPSSLMGATKRAAERVVLSCFGGPARGTAVRFGNVLGSRGSVVPLFQRQIAAGGPVTVTSPSALRYFMTVSEAVQLVLHASAISSGGEIFHLDMGEPVRIVDLAEQLVRLSGLEPGTDIQVVFTGLRPGEKLAESLGAEGGRIEATQHPRIKVWRDGGADRLESAWLDELTAAADRRDTSALVQLVRAAVPDYLPSSLVLEDLSTDVGTAAGMGPAVRAG